MAELEGYTLFYTVLLVIKIKRNQLFAINRVRLWNGRCKIQILGRSNRTQCFKRLATSVLFFQKKLCCLISMTWRYAPQTRYTLRRNTASVIEDLL